MKKIALITLILMQVVIGHAQSNEQASASQSSKLVMSNAIDITFNSTGSNNGGNVNLAFANVNDFANGVESAVYQLNVRSNKKFRVQAKSSSSRFTYSGSITPAPLMNVQNILFLKVTNNQTGGTVGSSFNNKYRTMRNSSQTIINNATPGGNNSFNIQYKATPGFGYPAGTYTVDIVYTATQL